MKKSIIRFVTKTPKTGRDPLIQVGVGDLDWQMLYKKFNVDDKIFKSISLAELREAMKIAGSIEYSENFNWLQRQIWKARYALASYSEYDFGFSYLMVELNISKNNMAELYWDSGYVEGVPFIRFELSNTLYNIPDAGNFMWGHKAYLNKLPKGVMLDAAAKNEGGADTNADTRAILSGFNYRF
ncbi:hypothetical protein [Aquimarina megaterium]|uniref:hypothetical protein n=1 Tax=Aquimarina megaterium TaxID=1443666 RepID=UPI00094588FF|nr:hypothetical protein [Aquimarina megaterium]